MKKKIHIFSLMAAALMAVIMSATVWSQTGTSRITGQVTDPQDKAVAGATVKLIGEQGIGRTATTNEDGVYSFPSVQTGTYRIEVEMSGFKKASVSTFQALVDSAATINVKIEVGDVSETVNVEAAGLDPFARKSRYS